MPMNSCNECLIEEKFFDLGCFSHCGDITLPIKANNSGIHIFYFTVNGIQQIFRAYQRKGDSIKIHNYFNEETFNATLKISEPTGKKYKYKYYDPIKATCTEYDQFLICIKITNVIIEPCINPCCKPILTLCENDPV